VVRPERHLPPDAVRMNRRVLFRVGRADRTESRFLVYPQQYHTTGQYLSVLSPLGVALLGLREGSGMAFRDLGGTAQRVSVEKVVCDGANGVAGAATGPIHPIRGRATKNRLHGMRRSTTWCRFDGGARSRPS